MLGIERKAIYFLFLTFFHATQLWQKGKVCGLFLLALILDTNCTGSLHFMGNGLSNVMKWGLGIVLLLKLRQNLNNPNTFPVLIFFHLYAFLRYPSVGWCSVQLLVFLTVAVHFASQSIIQSTVATQPCRLVKQLCLFWSFFSFKKSGWALDQLLTLALHFLE